MSLYTPSPKNLEFRKVVVLSRTATFFKKRVRSMFCSLNLLYFEVLITGFFLANRRAEIKNNLSRLTRSGNECLVVFSRSQSIQSNFGTKLHPLQDVVTFVDEQICRGNSV